MAKNLCWVLKVGCLFLTLSGCASSRYTQDLESLTRQQAATIQSLDREIKRLNEELKGGVAGTFFPSNQNLSASFDFDQMKTSLEGKLSQGVLAGDLSVSSQDKGIVVTVLDRVLFDPGQPTLKPSSQEALAQVALILNGEAARQMVYIEGHTDNQPVAPSVWKSNWELSTARATEVVHFFVGQMGVDPARLAATGYGEYRPLFSNNTPEGRMKNRRVEIVISPKTLDGGA